MNTYVPPEYADMVKTMEEAHGRLIDKLITTGYKLEKYPKLNKANSNGIAAAKAYPIQGILKYHGMTDWDWRTTYLPSISVNNDAAYSITYVEYNETFVADELFIGGKQLFGRELERVTKSLDAIRTLAGIQTKAKVMSKNVTKAKKIGKGLGTSASASAALATAAVAALYGPDVINNTRFLSTMSRMLAGSGCRSSVGGISLWLSYPGVAHEDSFAVRLDDKDQLADVSLITVPIDSRINLGTESAHEDAPRSLFYRPWMMSRLEETIECIDSVQNQDWVTVGQLAELDSIRLHGITMSGSRENKIFAWEPENISLFRMCNDLRSQGVPVYFSTDTGPTTVFITSKKYESEVVSCIQKLNMGFEIVTGKIAGPSQLLDVNDALVELAI